MSTEKRTIPEASIDTMLIYGMLRKMEIGDILTKSEVVAELGRSWDTLYPNISTAKNMVRREDGIVIKAVHKIGLKRLNDEEIVEDVLLLQKKTRRATNRTKKTLQCVNIDKLGNGKSAKLFTAMSIVSLFETITKHKSMEMLEQHVQQAALPVGKTLELFK